jgi:hypothetical protein
MTFVQAAGERSFRFSGHNSRTEGLNAYNDFEVECDGCVNGTIFRWSIAWLHHIFAVCGIGSSRGGARSSCRNATIPVDGCFPSRSLPVQSSFSGGPFPSDLHHSERANSDSVLPFCATSTFEAQAFYRIDHGSYAAKPVAMSPEEDYSLQRSWSAYSF